MDSMKNSIPEEVNSLWCNLAHRFSPEDMLRIQASYQLAAEAHKDQKRKTGEPYITHPIAVARIVGEEFKLGANPVIAAFLHDVVEDTSFTIDDIKARFGEDVAFLVRVVTKRKKEHYDTSKQVDNFRQILDSVHYDIRALLVKLADRLHNMRTLDSMSANKQMKIAGETDYFYAPLANRLGLYDVKTELENLSLRFRCPNEYAELKKMLERDEASNKIWLDSFLQHISEELYNHGIQARVYASYRMPYSIWLKMKASGRDFDHIDFRHVVYIVFPDSKEVSDKNRCLQIYSVLTDIFKEKPGGLANYVDSPKENGYRSLHVELLNKRGLWEEVHISSEQMVLNSKMGCISSRTESGVDNWIKKFKNVLQDIAYHSKDGGFMENVITEFYNDDIRVYSPKGEAVVLPLHSTALDFAFEIHSKVGEHAQYARINGRLCSIKTELKRGDCVEIGVNENVYPSPDWIDYVTTYKARHRILSCMRHVKSIPYQRCATCRPLPGDEVVGFRDPDGSVTIHRRDCRSAIILASKYGDSIVDVDFNEDQDILYPVTINIRAIDRYHLLIDLVHTITEDLQLSISALNTVTVDELVDCTINFSVHSVRELNIAIQSINAIEGVDEVRRKED